MANKPKRLEKRPTRAKRRRPEPRGSCKCRLVNAGAMAAVRKDLSGSGLRCFDDGTSAVESETENVNVGGIEN